MICIRCQMVVRYELEQLGLKYAYVKIGEAEILGDIQPEQLELLNIKLKEAGLSLIHNKKTLLVERMKNVIIELVHYTDEEIKMNLSDYLSDKLDFNYTYLANIFSEETASNIEKFYLSHKIERVKELIVYDELNLTEIAWKLHYSSVAHLSTQFKKHTGLTPSEFRKLKSRDRVTLDIT